MHVPAESTSQPLRPANPIKLQAKMTFIAPQAVGARNAEYPRAGST